jgi:hypothetical protein
VLVVAITTAKATSRLLLSPLEIHSPAETRSTWMRQEGFPFLA